MEGPSTGAGLAARMRSQFLAAQGLPPDAPLAAAFGGPLARCCPPDRTMPSEAASEPPAAEDDNAVLGVPGPVPSRVVTGIAVGLPYSGANGAPDAAAGVPMGRAPPLPAVEERAEPLAPPAPRPVAAPSPRPLAEAQPSFSAAASTPLTHVDRAPPVVEEPAATVSGGQERSDTIAETEADAARLRALKAARSMLARR